MSLWEKWEKEKLEIDAERHNDVKIPTTSSKFNIRKQIGILLGVVIACLVVVYLLLTLNALTGHSWTDTYIVHFMAEREAQRQNTRKNDA